MEGWCSIEKSEPRIARMTRIGPQSRRQFVTAPCFLRPIRVIRAIRGRKNVTHRDEITQRNRIRVGTEAGAPKHVVSDLSVGAREGPAARAASTRERYRGVARFPREGSHTR